MFQPEEYDRPRPEDFRAPYFFCSIGEADKIHYVTPSVADVLGYDPVRMIGKTFQHLILPDDPLNLEPKSESSSVNLKSHHGGTVSRSSMSTLRSNQNAQICAVKNAQGERRILSIMASTVAARTATASTATASTATASTATASTATASTVPGSGRCGAVRTHLLAQDVTGQRAMVMRVRQRLSEICSQISKLSDRDRIISEAATKGRSNESVAEELDVSVRTIERCRRELKKQFGVNHVAEIVTLLSECNTLENLWQLHTPEPWQVGLGADGSQKTSGRGLN